MSDVEQLLKPPSPLEVTPPHAASAKDDSNTVNGESTRINRFERRWKKNEATISKVVQDVVQRSMLRTESVAGSMVIDDCVASVIKSVSTDRSWNHPPSVQMEMAENVDNGHSAMDDMEPPPKLFAIENPKRGFDQHRYRKRRRRRFFGGRRPTRRYPIKVDAPRAQPRKSRRSTETVQENAAVTSKKEEQNSFRIDAQVHTSVFSPDQCGLMKSSREHRRNYRDNSNGSIPTCWHSSMNEKILPHLSNFKNGELSKASTWSVDTVSAFVKALPACPPTVAEKFREEQIDGAAFLLLTQDDLIKLMNIRLGPAVKIHNAIMLLKHKRLNGTKK